MLCYFIHVDITVFILTLLWHLNKLNSSGVVVQIFIQLVLFRTNILWYDWQQFNVVTFKIYTPQKWSRFIFLIFKSHPVTCDIYNVMIYIHQQPKQLFNKLTAMSIILCLSVRSTSKTHVMLSVATMIFVNVSIFPSTDVFRIDNQMYCCQNLTDLVR